MYYILYNYNFWKVVNSWDTQKFKAKNITKGKNIKTSTIETSIPSQLFFDLEEFKKPNEFKFTDFNLTLKQNEDFEEFKNTPENKFYEKPLTLFFETTKKISKISFDLFHSKMNSNGKQLLGAKFAVEILNYGGIKEKVEPITFNLMEIQKEENSLKMILGRPAEEAKNPIKAKGSLYIEFMHLTGDTKTCKITLDAEEKIEDNFTYTTFTVKKDEKNLKLYHAITKEGGLVSITLNGEKGMIGTYVFFAYSSEDKICIYSDKLISIPFGAKPGFFTKKVIILITVVGILILGGIFTYFIIKNKR